MKLADGVFHPHSSRLVLSMHYFRKADLNTPPNNYSANLCCGKVYLNPAGAIYTHI